MLVRQKRKWHAIVLDTLSDNLFGICMLVILVCVIGLSYIEYARKISG